MKTIVDLQAFIASKGIRNFAAHEVCPVGKKAGPSGPALKLAPEGLWDFIIPTLEVLEWLRAEFGAPITILSGYRDPEYNRAIGGEKHSLHMEFNATDIRIKGVSVRAIADKLLDHPDAKQLGLGRYSKQGFVHIDTRGMIDHKAPARWGGDDTDASWWLK